MVSDLECNSGLKYKVGDEVVVVSNDFKNVKDMIGFVGKVLEANENSTKFHYSVGNDDDEYWFAESELELVEGLNGKVFKCVGGGFSLLNFVDIGDEVIVKGLSLTGDQTHAECHNTKNLKDFTVPVRLFYRTDCFVEVEGTVGVVEKEDKQYNPLVVQEGGGHYKTKGIQPVEYGLANNLSFTQVNIVKYVTRHEDKNGLEDLSKSIHYHFFEALRCYGVEGSTELKKRVLKMLGENDD